MKPRVLLSEWKSPKAEQRFRDLEAGFWREHWPDPPVSIDVDTHLGPTRAYYSQGEGEPVVFLHGIGGTSVTWAEFVAARPGRATYAIDTIGDLGRSEQRVAVKDNDDLAQWLDEVLAGLGIEPAHLVGTSYGGFLALNQAVRRPGRVRSLALLEPAAIVPVRLLRFLVWGFAIGLSGFLPRRLRSIAARKLRMPVVEDKGMLRMVRLGQMKHRTRVIRPQPLTDEQLRSITVPVLLLVGEKSEVFPPLAVKERAVSLIPNVDVEVVAGAGHALAMSHAAHAIARLAGFLEAQSRSPR